MKFWLYDQLDYENSTKAVMVWIHGGSWFMSSGNGGLADIYGPRYFLDRDIVLVTINYRLGPLGCVNKLTKNG
jgi:carboxylesterase type B